MKKIIAFLLLFVATWPQIGLLPALAALILLLVAGRFAIA